MKLPINEQWKVDASSDKGFDILATRNISFRNRKLARLGAKTVCLFDENDGLETPIAFYGDDTSGEIDKVIGTDDDVHDITIHSPTSIAFDGDSNVAHGSADSSAAYFNGEWVVSESADIHSYDGSSWTDRVVTLTSGVRHPLCTFKNRDTLLVGNGNVVKQLNTSFSETTNLTLPAGIEVTSIAYNRHLVAIVGASSSGDAFLFIWDGTTASANYGYSLNSHRGIFVVAYEDSFITLTGSGEGLYWTGSGLKRLFAFPTYYKTQLFSEYRSTARSIGHDTSVLVDKQRVYMNVQVGNDSKNEEKDEYDIHQPSGVWVFDPAVGLHHLQGHTSDSKVIEMDVAHSDVDLATDTLTYSGGGVPETGTPVIQVNSIYELTPVKVQKTYYTIKVSDTEFQLAETYTEAIAGTALDLTAKVSNTFEFTFFPSPDFGQLSLQQYGGGMAKTTSQSESIIETSLYSSLVFGAPNVYDGEFASLDTLMVDSPFGENRGSMLMQKLFSPTVTSSWQKLIVKAQNIVTDLDKVLLKARVEEDSNMPIFVTSDDDRAQWTSATTFTTTADLEYAQVGYEIEFIRGYASGYLAHITDITEDAGTYTVTIDETIKNYDAGVTLQSEFVVDNFLKVKTSEDTDSPNEDSNKNYIEFTFGDMFQASKWIQFKFELRGSRVAIEEYEPIVDDQKQ
jgi:hypothetical protein